MRRRVDHVVHWPDLGDAPNPELVDMTRRFRIGFVLGAPVFALAMGDMLTGTK